jgi:hypothetical protein
MAHNGKAIEIAVFQCSFQLLPWCAYSEEPQARATCVLPQDRVMARAFFPLNSFSWSDKRSELTSDITEQSFSSDILRLCTQERGIARISQGPASMPWWVRFPSLISNRYLWKCWGMVVGITAYRCLPSVLALDGRLLDLTLLSQVWFDRTPQMVTGRGC